MNIHSWITGAKAVICCLFIACTTTVSQQTSTAAAGKTPASVLLAPVPPMGWNSWDCFGTTVTESDVKANAEYMATHLRKYGWQYIIVDIQWYEPNAAAHGYRKNAELVTDNFGRLMPAVNRFPSAAEGKGFKPLADYIHSLGLKFGIHIMRGIPRQAVRQNLPVAQTSYTARDIADTNSVCPWNTDMYSVNAEHPGGQAYYTSILELYRDWGVDYIKADDMTAFTNKPADKNRLGEINALHNAIKNSGRPIVLSLSPGPASVDQAEFLNARAQLWRISDDFWDNWKDIVAQFGFMRRWNPHRVDGCWPDADMLPLGKIGIRAERGNARSTHFTPDEQVTLMSLWSLFRSPLMFGGNLPDNDAATLSLITNEEVLAVNQHSEKNTELYADSSLVIWTANVPGTKGRYVGLFNISDRPMPDAKIAWKQLKSTSNEFTVRDLWKKKDLGTFTGEYSVALPPHGAALVKVTPVAEAMNVQPVKELIRRTVPAHADDFIIEPLISTGGKDAFEIESRGSKIVLRGTTGVAAASALYCYLNEYAHCQITWNGTNLKLPKQLPAVPTKQHRDSPYEHRYYLNYCTFNYTMSWWDWERWEQEIDWMALHGITMPLAITGEEYVWHEVYTSLGFSEADLNTFFCGPTYFSWFWMGNLDGWGGPLSTHWMERQRDLQQKIVKRERELGMTPVLPAFTGHVPAAFTKYFPAAKLKQTNWGNDFSDTYILNSEDPMFAELGRKFLEAQTRLYGTDHLYSADTFNENEPPSDDPQYLASLSARVYEGMKSADPEAVWVMQGWLFFSDRKFWKAPQIKGLLDAVPDDRMIILDLAAEIEPVWKRTDAFYGKPWIWNMLHNFGGNISLFGRIEGVAEGPAMALNDPSSRRMTGIGLTMEGIEQNPVLYELMTHHTWTRSVVDLNTWLPEYIRNRYGAADPHAISAWNILRTTVYNGKKIRDGAESIVAARPTMEPGTRWVQTTLNYAPEELLPAWKELTAAASSCSQYDGYRYDIVDVTRQVLANYALVLHTRFVDAYKRHDEAQFKQNRAQFLELIGDMDKLLATRKDFMLGPWIADARKCGATPEEKALYERNARDLITLWGGANNRLHEYSCRQWSGLLNDFYAPRWVKFFGEVTAELRGGKVFDAKEFEKEMQQWEWQWVTTQKAFPVKPAGDPVRTAASMYKKYYTTIAGAYAHAK